MTDMITAAYRPARALIHNDVIPDSALARRLLIDLPFRCHALPVAETDGAITGVKGNPEDPAVCDEISAALGAASCFVRGRKETINASLNSAWLDSGNPGYRFLVCETPERFDALNSYACSIGDLFHADVERLEWIENSSRFLSNLARKTDEGYDLLILGPQVQSFRRHLAACPMRENIINQLSISLLVVQRSRWPISKILILIQGEERDKPAVEWGVHLAQASNAEITLLTIVPSVPGMYQGLERFNWGLLDLLSTKSQLGQQLRWAAERLVKENLDGTLQLRRGSQEWQIRRELLAEEYDLIIIPAETEDRLHKYFLGAVTCHLLYWTDMPVLIAK
jgi:nucleotide-binding universal stress UspA family protein